MGQLLSVSVGLLAGALLGAGAFWAVARARRRWAERRRKENAPFPSETPFADFLEHLGDIAYSADDQGRITYANPASQAITGLPVEEVIGKSFLPLFTPESQEIATDVKQSGGITSMMEKKIYDKVVNDIKSGRISKEDLGGLGDIEDLEKKYREKYNK